ncbi:MAG: GAF domain-containing protein [Pseudomonadota bacterium]|nr:GAF domain-containing protein [Pseudomonadota bacterium]
MKTPNLPHNETERLRALRESGLLDSDNEERFDRVTRLASRAFDVPIALISLIDRDRQWFKACIGLDTQETPRAISFCGHTILGSGPMIIEDAARDDRFRDNPLVLGAPHIRFYAGMPVCDSSGFAFGTLCLIDTEPRTFSEDQRIMLREFAALVERELGVLELRSHWDSRDQALRLLNDMAMDHGEPFDARIKGALAKACDFLGMSNGIVSSITSDAYTVLWHHSQSGDALASGFTLPLEKTYCSLLLQQDRELAIEHMSESTFRRHPCFAEFGLESYLAAPIRVDNDIVGTLNFSDPKPRTRPFQEPDILFVNLMSRWVADMLHQQRQSETLAKLANHAPGLLYQYRWWPDGRSAFPYASRGIIDIYGVNPEEVQHDASPVFDRIHPDDLDPIAASIQQSAEELSPWQRQYRVKGQSLDWDWVEGRANPERLPDGSTLWHGYIVNINERRRVDMLKDQFVSTVSHELRTPLTSIAGALGLVLGGATGTLNSKTRGMLDIAQRNTQHLKRLINDLLDLEKFGHGSVQLTVQRHLLKPLVNEAIEDIRPFAEDTKTHIRAEFEDNTTTAMLDAVRFKQALTNLLSNALKFSPAETSVYVRAYSVGDRVRVSVRDEGPGIPDHFRERVFERFAQADASVSRRSDGSGLGLAITKDILEAMGGRIMFESVTGQGTTFTVELPG